MSSYNSFSTIRLNFKKNKKKTHPRLPGGVSAPGEVPGPGGVCSWGVPGPGGSASGGVVCLGGCLLWGCLLPGGCLLLGVSALGGGIPACTEADPLNRMTDRQV